MAPEPAHRLPSDTDDGMLLIVSGPSGVGKTTIARTIERRLQDATFSISATTRDKTEADVDGVDYFFLTEGQFLGRLKAGDFLEHASYADKHYGTLAEPAQAQLDRGRVVILDIEVQGAIQVKQQLPEALSLFILPPSEEELLRRLRERDRDTEEHILQRFELARSEIAEAKESGAYDYFITNDTLEHAIDEALSIIRRERSERSEQA
jgi:guanylate kinase